VASGLEGPIQGAAFGKFLGWQPPKGRRSGTSCKVA